MKDNLKDIAESMNADLKALSAKKLYVTANFFGASDNYPDRIVVEGIKNPRSTGKFTNDDILQVRTAIKKHFSSKTLAIEENLSDKAMYIAVITKKDNANESESSLKESVPHVKYSEIVDDLKKSFEEVLKKYHFKSKYMSDMMRYFDNALFSEESDYCLKYELDGIDNIDIDEI